METNIRTKFQMTHADREELKQIFRQLQKNPASLRDLEMIENLLLRSIAIAENYGTVDNALLDGLRETAANQLVRARELPMRDKGKWNAIAELKLHLTGDLLGWV